MKVTSEAHALC